MAERRRAWTRLGATLARSVGLILALTSACSATVKDDETVILFPTAAHFDPAEGVWVVPARIAHILIRDVTGEARRPERLEAAFARLPASLWTVFVDPVDLRELAIPVDNIAR